MLNLSELGEVVAKAFGKMLLEIAEQIQESGASSNGTSSSAEKPPTPLAAAKAATAPKSPKSPAKEKAAGSTSGVPEAATTTGTAAATAEKIAAHVCGPHAMHLDPAKYKAMIVAPAECYYCKQAAAQTVPSLTLKDVTAKAKELVEKCGKPKLAEILKEFGVAAVTPGPGKVSLPESEYSNFFKMCVALMNAEATPPAIEEEEPL